MKVFDIQFVIVLYKEKLENCLSFRSLIDCLTGQEFKSSLLVYDNSPFSQQISQNDLLEIEYFHDENNSGLSTAYNLAAKNGAEKGKSWLFILDQDTFFPAHSLNIYIDAINIYPTVKLFAPILQIANGLFMSPCKYKYKWGKLMKTVEPGIHSFANSVPVNSGLCINLEAYFRVGGYNDKVRVDGADFQFVERFKILYPTFYALDLIFKQDFSLFEEDRKNLQFRFQLFLGDVKNFEATSFLDKLLFHRLALVRTCVLTLQTRSPIFFKLYWKHYLFSK